MGEGGTKFLYFFKLGIIPCQTRELAAVPYIRLYITLLILKREFEVLLSGSKNVLL